LTAISGALERLAPLLERAAAEPAPQARAAQREAPAKKTKMSASRLAALKLHGQYIGYMRNLKPRQKAQVQALRASKGVDAAIALGKKLARA
jgi:hypothetical protein